MIFGSPYPLFVDVDSIAEQVDYTKDDEGDENEAFDIRREIDTAG